jgi:hypothetical protein
MLAVTPARSLRTATALAASAWLGLAAPGSAATSTPMPWQMLEFKASKLWVTAAASLRLTPTSNQDGEDAWQLVVNSSVASNQARMESTLNPDNGQLFHRLRHTVGSKQRRLKEYEYSDVAVIRVRRTPPPDNPDAAESSWNPTSRKRLSLEQLDPALPITSSYALLALAAGPQLAAVGDSLELLVHTDHNFYTVTLKVARALEQAANFTLMQGDVSQQISGDRTALLIAVMTSAARPLEDTDDFNLLGLTGPLTIVIDRETRLPLQINGRAPRLGNVALPLVSASQ